MHPTVVAVCTSPRKGERKTPVDAVELRSGHGIVGDAHAGDWHRQVSLLALESIKKKQLIGLFFDARDYAENIITKGIVLTSLKLGTKLIMGEAVLEVTQIGNGSIDESAIPHATSGSPVPKENVFVKVLQGGIIKPGDLITLLEQETTGDIAS